LSLITSKNKCLKREDLKAVLEVPSEPEEEGLSWSLEQDVEYLCMLHFRKCVVWPVSNTLDVFHHERPFQISNSQVPFGYLSGLDLYLYLWFNQELKTYDPSRFHDAPQC
jgi:hypothetical protein